MFGIARNDDYKLGLQKQTDTMTALGGLNKDVQNQQQFNHQEDLAKDQFNTTALNNYTNYANTTANDKYNLQNQGMSDYSNYMNQGQANSQQRFNTLDSQMYQQQQFKDNQQQQNTQYLENHPMTMQYNNGNQTQTFTQSLREGGYVHGHYAPGGHVLDAFPVKGPMGNAILENGHKNNQEMALPGMAATANEPGGYGYTLQNPSVDPYTPYIPFNPYSGNTGYSSANTPTVTGQGNLSPTASGGNITFNPVINTGDGTASGGGGSSGNTAPISANTSQSQQFDPMQFMMMKHMMGNKNEPRTATNAREEGATSNKTPPNNPKETMPEEVKTPEAGLAEGKPASITSNKPNEEEDLNSWDRKKYAEDGEGIEMMPVSSWSKNSSTAPLDTSTDTAPSVESSKLAPAYDNTNPGFFKKQQPTTFNKQSNLETIPESLNEDLPEDAVLKTPKKLSTVDSRPRFNASTNPNSKAKVKTNGTAKQEIEMTNYRSNSSKQKAVSNNGNAVSKAETSFPKGGDIEMSPITREIAEFASRGGLIGRTRYGLGGDVHPPQAVSGAFGRMEQSYSNNRQIPMQNNLGAVATFANNGLTPPPQPSTWQNIGEAAKDVAPFAMMAMLKQGGTVQNFKEGGMVSDQPVFTRAKSLRENSRINDHPFKSSAKTSNYGNYGGFEVSNDDDCPRLDLPFKPGFR
jgi:hypothetical protein